MGSNSNVHDPKLDSLVLDLVEWVARQPRSYAQTMDAWRTSCPRLPVWEDAVDRGFIVRETATDGETLVKALAKLPLRDREILSLHYENELTFDEIGKILRSPLNTVKSRHRRALISLRKILQTEN